MTAKRNASDLMGLAEHLVTFGRAQGADEVEVSIAEGTEFNVDVRLGRLENLVEAGSRVVCIRVIKDKKTAFVTSEDLSKDTLHQLVKNAVQRAMLASPDQFSGLPVQTQIQADISALQLYDPAVPELETAAKINIALETERIALGDKRITNSHGASFETREITSYLANSKGFADSYAETFCHLGVGLQAGETDDKAEDSWSSMAVQLAQLESAEEVAQKAVERTVRLLQPRKIPTQSVPVIFEPPMTSWLLAFIFACISGVSVYQKASFLAGRLEEQIGNPLVDITDDGLMPGKLGTRPFDAEGVPTRRTKVFEKGVLRHYLCNTYAARKLGLRSTGNASGNSVGPNNFYLAAGKASPEQIVSETKKGLILVRTIGQGLNPVTGDISRGAFGLWVERGEVVHPISEVTISGNLGTILQEIEEVGCDLEFRSAFAGPTVKVAEMTVAGV